MNQTNKQFASSIGKILYTNRFPSLPTRVILRTFHLVTAIGLGYALFDIGRRQGGQAESLFDRFARWREIKKERRLFALKSTSSSPITTNNATPVVTSTVVAPILIPNKTATDNAIKENKIIIVTDNNNDNINVENSDNNNINSNDDNSNKKQDLTKLINKLKQN